MLLLSVALALGAIALYVLTPALLIYASYPWPVYALFIASVVLAVASRRAGVLRYVTIAGTGIVTVSFFVVTLFVTRLDHGQLAVRAGEAFPDFTLPTSTQATFSPAQLKGHSAALYIFYRGDW